MIAWSNGALVHNHVGLFMATPVDCSMVINDSGQWQCVYGQHTLTIDVLGTMGPMNMFNRNCDCDMIFTKTAIVPCYLFT